jgi:hypothetical protein
MTTPLIPYYDTLTIEKDPADDHAFAPRSTEGLCRCGAVLVEDRTSCELCRHAVQDEGDL